VPEGGWREALLALQRLPVTFTFLLEPPPPPSPQPPACPQSRSAADPAARLRPRRCRAAARQVGRRLPPRLGSR